MVRVGMVMADYGLIPAPERTLEADAEPRVDLEAVGRARGLHIGAGLDAGDGEITARGVADQEPAAFPGIGVLGGGLEPRQIFGG